MSSDEAKAREFYDKAEKRIKGGNILGSIFGGGSQRYENSASDFTKAANLFKMSKKWDQAGDAFQKAAECFLKAASKHDAAQSYVSASNCYKKGNISNAILTLKAAIEYYTDEGRFSTSAKLQKEMAEMYESEGDFDQAIASYQVAADLFSGENSNVSSHQCLLKIALFSAQLERYDKAIEIYEQVAAASLDNNLTQWGCKEYFFRAILCYLASDDLVSAERALMRYRDMQASFSSTREFRFLDQIIKACRDHSVEDFSDAVAEFDSISPLDAWKSSILVRAKRTITGDESVA
eukprot:gene2761-3435_t